MVRQYMAAWAHGEKERSSLYSCAEDKGGGNALPITSWTCAQCWGVTTPHHFFSSISIKGIRCLKHGFIPQHERRLAAHLTLLKLECDLTVLVAVRNGFTATGTLVSM